MIHRGEFSLKDKYKVSDQEKAYRNQAIEYDSGVFVARGCVGFILGIVLMLVPAIIFPSFPISFSITLFFVGLIGLPYYMYSSEKENIKKATDEANMEAQKAANERRVALKSSEFLSNAPTTLIANSIKYNKDLRKDAIKAKSYKELVQIEKEKNLSVLYWNDENVEISLSDDRLNIIELDALVKKIKAEIPIKQEDNIDKRNNKGKKENKKSGVHNDEEIDQLRKLKVMLDENLITEEDYDNKKKQLLNL